MGEEYRKFYGWLYEELSLYVRHSAYLNAVPERLKHDQSEAPLLSRLEARRKDWARAEEGRVEEEYRADMPPVEDAIAFMIGYLFDPGETGITVAAGMGAGPITHERLVAWQFNTGVELMPWQSRFLIRLSSEYVAESHKATQHGAKAPWLAEGEKPEPTAAQAALRALANS